MIRNEIKKLIKQAVKTHWDVDLELDEIKIDYPPEDFGDYATNVAMKMAKIAKSNPMEAAEDIAEHLRKSDLFEKIDVAKPGFINFYLKNESLQKQISSILNKKENFGSLDIGKNKKTQVEFISANPTGPLTLGNGRGGFYGDVLANILTKAGYEVEREYYINDIGEQIRALGRSVLQYGETVDGKLKAVYAGNYIGFIKTYIEKGEFFSLSEINNQKDKNNPQKIGKLSADYIMWEIIKPTIEEKMQIKFDEYFFESELHPEKVDEIINYLKEKKLAYEKEDALWFKSTQFGDDKDRVLVKADGEKTYLASDIAYLKNKFERGFKKLVYIWGADHHGYVGRLKAAAKALEYNPDNIEIIIMQLVRLMSDGKEVKMSKRAGTYVTIDELIDEVGLDVARFFFLMYSPDAHMNFDLDLAKEHSQKNPVYYAQYAHARMCSIFAKSDANYTNEHANDANVLKLLNQEIELRLIKQLIKFPEIIEDSARDYQVHCLPHYALDLVRQFHKFYEECRVINEKNPALTEARLALVRATQIVLKNSLDLMGISAPEKM
jgi:arginyl-tRNA synthetase